MVEDAAPPIRRRGIRTAQKIHSSRAGVGDATDSRQLLDYRVHSSLVVAYSRVRHTRVGRTLEYATAGKDVL